MIRCWDLSTEKCYNSFDSKSEASLTALTNAWCYEHNGGYAGIGPDVIVAGYGNGSLRVFDIRSNTGEPVHIMNEGRPSLRGRMYSKFDEHTNWIVDVSFTTYGGRHEVSLRESDFCQDACLSLSHLVSAFRLSLDVSQVHSNFGICAIHPRSAQSITKCK